MSRSNQLLLEKDAVRSALQALTRSQDNLTLLKEEVKLFSRTQSKNLSWVWYLRILEQTFFNFCKTITLWLRFIEY